MRRTVGLVAFLLALTAAPAYADGVDLSDYAVGDCVTDDSAHVQAAIDAWHDGTLRLGSGCYRLAHTVRVAHADGSPVFGDIVGDGPGLTRFKADRGIGFAFRFEDWWLSHMQGFSVEGAGYGTWGAGNNTDTGILFGAGHQDLGTAGGTVEGVTVGGFGTCWMMGDNGVPPLSAAAEFVMTNVGGNYCGDGLAFASYNTLDFVLLKVGFLHSRTAFHTVYGGPGQITIVGGASTNNEHELNIRGDCTSVVMTNYRSEGGPQQGIPILAGGCPGQKLEITSSVLSATSLFAPVSIQLDNGDSQVYLRLNNLNGQVQSVQGLQTIFSMGNTIVVPEGTPPYGFSDANCCGAIRLYEFGDRGSTAVAGMWPDTRWFEVQGEWLFPPNSDAAKRATPVPTSTPVAATAVPTATPTAIPPTATPVPSKTPTVAPTATAQATACVVSLHASNATRSKDGIDFDVHFSVPACT